MNAKHTPGDWITHNDIDGTEVVYVAEGHQIIAYVPTGRNSMRQTGGRLPVFEEGKANAEFIVRACNAHDDLLAVCKMVLVRLELEAFERGEDAVFPCAAMRDSLRRVIDQATGAGGPSGTKPYPHECDTRIHVTDKNER